MHESNPILEELHRIREDIANKAGGDLHKIVAEARQRALRSGRAIEIQEFIKQNQTEREWTSTSLEEKPNSPC